MGKIVIDKNGKKICNLLKKSEDLTISDVVSKVKLSRATTRIALAKLEGMGKIDFKKIGMAKVYFLKK
jgi:predicted transcriptional regulator